MVQKEVKGGKRKENLDEEANQSREIGRNRAHTHALCTNTGITDLLLAHQ